MFKKALFTSLTLGVLATSFLSFMAPSAKAQGAWYAPSYQQWYTKVYDTSNPTEIYGERYTAAQVWWVIYSIQSWTLSWIAPVEVWQCFFTAFSDCGTFGITDATTAPLPYASAPVEGPSFVTAFSSVMFADRPLSGITYTKDVLRNFHIVPEAKAQSGFGFDSLTMIQNLWGAARDITYALLILVIIVFAFMIMFRTKISPQAVITVQSALPKIIVTLLLITFSYAIAGFMIDAMYIVLGLISLLFTNSGVITSLNIPGGQSGAGALFTWLTSGPASLGIIGTLIIYWITFMLTLFAATFLPGGFLGLLATIVTFGAYQATFMGIGVIISIIVSIMLIIISVKAVITLIKTFVNTVLLIIAGPFIILFGAVSKSGGGIGGWIRSLAANLAVYPMTALLLLVAFVFLDAAYQNTTVGALQGVAGSVPLVGKYITLLTTLLPAGILGISATSGISGGNTWSPPLTLGTSAGIVWLWLFASLGTIALIPKVAEIVKGAITGKPFAYGSAIGQAVGAPVGAGLGAAGFIAGRQAQKAKDVFGPNTPQETAWTVASSLIGAARKKVG